MKQQTFRLIWGIFMTLFYLAMAFIIIAFDIFQINPTFKVIIGILFFAYGLFRGYRVWKSI